MFQALSFSASHSTRLCQVKHSKTQFKKKKSGSKEIARNSLSISQMWTYMFHYHCRKEVVERD